jgi:hypothetical protein
MTNLQILITFGCCLASVWAISLIWFFIALAYDMLKAQDEDYINKQ